VLQLLFMVAVPATLLLLLLLLVVPMQLLRVQVI
jgi:hypothetical protein